MTYRIKCDVQVRGNDWGVSLGAGKLVSMNQDLGDGKTLADLIADGSVHEGLYERVDDEPAPPAFTDEEEF